MTAALGRRLRFAWAVLRHKWYVWRAGRFVGGVGLRRLLLHDLSKFSSAEWGPYARQFYGPKDQRRPDEFDQAVLHHYNTNDHHWQYWIPRSGGDDPLNRYEAPCEPPLAMPEVAVREMLADWLAAGRAYNGVWPDLLHWTWLRENRHRLRLHPETECRLYRILADLKQRQRLGKYYR